MAMQDEGNALAPSAGFFNNPSPVGFPRGGGDRRQDEGETGYDFTRHSGECRNPATLPFIICRHFQPMMQKMKCPHVSTSSVLVNLAVATNMRRNDGNLQSEPMRDLKTRRDRSRPVPTTKRLPSPHPRASRKKSRRRASAASKDLRPSWNMLLSLRGSCSMKSVS